MPRFVKAFEAYNIEKLEDDIIDFITSDRITLVDIKYSHVRDNQYPQYADRFTALVIYDEAFPE